MEKLVLSENELAQRWGMSPKTLQRWRSEGRGPRFLKPPLATSNSPTFGRANSPGQDGLIINHQCLRAQGVRPLP